MDITVPPGCAGGSSVEFTDASGRVLHVIVPDGLAEGDIFHVDIAPDFLDGILESLTQDRFAAILDQFVDRECHKFRCGGGGEHTLDQTTSHSNYVRFYGTPSHSKACRPTAL